MRKLIKEPLLHFLFIGVLLFLVFEFLPNSSGEEQDEIVITQGDIKSLKANFARTWQRPPTDRELTGIVEEFIREEIAYREAKAMGLDRDDSVIRRRLRMKMELLIEDIAGLTSPTDEELQTYLTANRENYSIPPQVSFMQVYLSPDRRGVEVENDALAVLADLGSAGEGADPVSYGDQNMLPGQLPLSYLDYIDRIFGKDFTRQLIEISPGRWSGPVWSSYGLHLVFVRKRIEGRDPELAEVRKEVERDWTAKRRKDIKEEMYQKLREKYLVSIEEAPDESLQQTAEAK